MIPRAKPQAPATRDDLAKVSFLNPRRMKKGLKGLERFLELEKKGASKADAFHETGGAKYADPDTETGIFRGADQLPRFELGDQHMSIRPEMNPFFHATAEGKTPRLPADQIVKHDDLFERMPELRMVDTRLVMPELQRAGESPYGGVGAYVSRQPGVNTGIMAASGRSHLRDPNSIRSGSLVDLSAHELGGHGVQDYEGFTSGSIPTDDAMRQAHDSLVFPRAKKYRDELEGFRTDLGMEPHDFAQEYPEANTYLKEARRLIGKPARDPRAKGSTLSNLERYQNVSGEQEATRVADRRTMSMEERNANPPWLPDAGIFSPYELQLRNQGGGRFDMMPDRGTLARLMRKGRL